MKKHKYTVKKSHGCPPDLFLMEYQMCIIIFLDQVLIDVFLIFVRRIFLFLENRRFKSHRKPYIELPRLWRSRGFLLHGLILSHESRITVLSPLFQRFIVSSIKSVNPCFRMFLAAFMSRSCVFWHCGHFHSVSYFRSLL